MMSNLKAAGHKEMPIVLKGDVQGSVEAITAALEKLGNDEVMARVIHGGGRRRNRIRRDAGHGLEGGHPRLQRARA